DRQRGPGAQRAHEIDAVSVGQAEIEQHQGRHLLGALPALGERARLDDAEALPGQRGAQVAAHLQVVLDDQHGLGRPAHAISAGLAGASAAGNVIWKRAPPSRRFAAVTVPPCASTMPRPTARPSPTPGAVDARKNLSNTLPSLPAGSPAP